MDAYDTGEAKARFDELIDRAAAGEEIEITRGGDISVRLVAAGPIPPRKRKPLDIEEMRRISQMSPPEPPRPDGKSFVQWLRETDQL